MPNGLNAFPVDPVLARAGQLSVEWERVSTLVPSVHHHLTLCPELAGESLTVTRDDWRLIRRLAAGGTAGDFSGHLDVSVVAATRRLAGLVERGIAVVEAPIEPVVATPAQAAPAVVVTAPVAVTPPVATETFAPVEGDAVPEGGEPVGEPVENVHASLAAFFAQDEQKMWHQSKSRTSSRRPRIWMISRSER